MIRTPKQLVTVVILAFIVPLVIILLTIKFITGGINIDPDSPLMSDEAIAERMRSKDSVTAPEIVPTSMTSTVDTVEDPGKTLYNSVCQACHVAGVAGAPKLDDKAAWEPRVALGNETLYQSVLMGKNMMPARGGATNASDEDIKAAVDFMLTKVK